MDIIQIDSNILSGSMLSPMTQDECSRYNGASAVYSDVTNKRENIVSKVDIKSMLNTKD